MSAAAPSPTSMLPSSAAPPAPSPPNPSGLVGAAATPPDPFEVDITIVGAGMAGAALAWHLAPHRRVLLLERESQPGYHSTGRSAAMYMASYGPPCARALTRASLALYRDPPAEFGVATLLSPRGALYVAAPEQQEALAALRAELAPTCPGLETWSAEQVLARVPCLRPERVAAALWDASSQDIDVHALHQGFLRGMRQAGGVLWTDAQVVAGQPLAAVGSPGDQGDQGDQGARGLRWCLSLADGRQVHSQVVVDAAGAWADELGQRLGAAPIGLQPKRRSAFTFAPPQGVAVHDWPLVAGVDDGWYFKPDAGQLLGSRANADDCPPHDVRPEELDIALGIHAIESETALTIRRPSATWAGLRSFVDDGELVIGWDDERPGGRPGLFWLAGQGGYGIQSAAGAGALAAALLLGGQTGAAMLRELLAEGVEPARCSPARLSTAV